MTNENLVDCENFVKKIASSNITENINYNRIMKKNIIRLTESQLHRVIKESVTKVLKEGAFDPYDEKYKDFQNDFSWNQFDMDNNDPTIDFEKTAHSRTPLQGNGYLNLYGNARDENWNVQDTHGLNAMNAMSNNPYARHQAQHMGSTLKQSSDNGMNDISKLGESKLHEISYGGTSKQGKPYDNYGIPKPIKVRESQLHNIVKESINKVIQEGWFGNLFNRGN